jgi:hypothetical protein
MCAIVHNNDIIVVGYLENGRRKTVKSDRCGQAETVFLLCKESDGANYKTVLQLTNGVKL